MRLRADVAGAAGWLLARWVKFVRLAELGRIGVSRGCRAPNPLLLGFQAAERVSLWSAALRARRGWPGSSRISAAVSSPS